MELIQNKNIKISQNISKDLEIYIKKENHSKIFILVDENTKKYCLNHIKLNNYHLIEIKSGENNKNLESANKIWEFLLTKKADRKSLMINLGGGIITDIGGFTASTYKRGMEFINIPTTTLGMIDASIGGKTAINLNFHKNIIGTFNTPKKVFLYFPFLNTLKTEEYLNGLAEAFKHALLDNRQHYEFLKNNINNPQKISPIVIKSINFKDKTVKSDYKENGKRKILNFGHTVGHALESYYKGNLRHGEAVISGIVSALYLSVKKFNFDISLQLEITNFLKEIYPLNIYTDFNNKEIINFILNDKKNINGKIMEILLKNIGHPVYDFQITIEELNESLNYLKEIYK